MATTIRLQRSHTRNSNDWSMVKTSTGRHAFVANKKGVALRIGLLVEFLQENHQSSVSEMTTHLQGVHKSYNDNDVRQPLRQMMKHGMVQQIGSGRDATYSLTNNGKRIWSSVKLQWS